MSDDRKEQAFEPEIVLLYCQHCLNSDTSVAAESKRASGFSVRSVLMPCSSKIEVPSLMKILAEGVDAVEVVACPETKCRFLVGSLRAERRIEYARGLLGEVDMEPERLGITRAAGVSAKKLIDIAHARARVVRAFEPNPMKKGDAK